MGSCVSKIHDQEDDVRLHTIQISSPTLAVRLTPKAERDPQTGLPIVHPDRQISRTELLEALYDVAAHMEARGQSVTLVTVGGAVNTILLETRESTHDVDFFSSRLSDSQISLVSQAGRDANAKCISKFGEQLGRKWLNNETTLYLGPSLLDRITRLAEVQNEPVFTAPGLTILAAPWNYAFISKLNRMQQPEKKDYDPKDAAHYLRRYLQREGRDTVKWTEVAQWGIDFGHETIKEADGAEVNEEYKRAYRVNAIDF
ncbi:hypothetical protein FH972_024083 [Carpinus fangiana]|uniref:DUF7582 domain-containing protein n=1 Tax=Carpinus fangiana TaxID=176857 RepID=A0A5N6KX13_9ROSI|nr:hypothetical protein FH972_024083 [Carpinus fangiana]